MYYFWQFSCEGQIPLRETRTESVTDAGRVSYSLEIHVATWRKRTN